MKTPDEIKKRLECARAKVDGRCDAYVACVCCPYFSEAQYPEDIIAYIQQLERERDAAVEDLRTMGEHTPCCETCFYNGTSEDEKPCMDCYAGYIENRWQWRGAQEVE